MNKKIILILIFTLFLISCSEKDKKVNKDESTLKSYFNVNFYLDSDENIRKDIQLNIIQSKINNYDFSNPNQCALFEKNIVQNINSEEFKIFQQQSYSLLNKNYKKVKFECRIQTSDILNKDCLFHAKHKIFKEVSSRMYKPKSNDDSSNIVIDRENEFNKLKETDICSYKVVYSSQDYLLNDLIK